MSCIRSGMELRALSGTETSKLQRLGANTSSRPVGRCIDLPFTMFASAIAAGLLFARLAECAIPLPLAPPQNASKPILDSFVSFSIEFSSFPDFAGRVYELLLRRIAYGNSQVIQATRIPSHTHS